MWKVQIRTDDGWKDVSVSRWYTESDASNAARIKSDQTKRPTRIRFER